MEIHTTVWGSTMFCFNRTNTDTKVNIIETCWQTDVEARKSVTYLYGLKFAMNQNQLSDVVHVMSGLAVLAQWSQKLRSRNIIVWVWLTLPKQTLPISFVFACHATHGPRSHDLFTFDPSTVAMPLSNATVLTRENKIWSLKKRQRKEQIKEISFDDEARR